MMGSKRNKERGQTGSSGKNFALIATLYLLGLFIGALDTGIVTPARTVIQTDLGVADSLGVWMITIYTLAYAVAIPVMGKLADRHGRKWIYLVSVGFFGLGSLFCGLAQDIGSFNFLLFARAIQAIGAGGIMPVATAEFGTTFPEEKRGMALGLVGGVYGIANIFGASAGSLILDIAGQANWQFIFYVNVPITIFIVLAGIFTLPNSKASEVHPIDGWGIVVLTLMTLSLLFGLKNIDFFNFTTSIAQSDVYPFLLAAALLIPIFILAERRAQDPVMNLSYFKNFSIVSTLILSVLTGVIMMGMVFIPQYAENALRMPSGDGGYFVIILGLFAGFGAPLSGKFIDKFGVKVVLGFGFVVSIVGSLYLALVSVANPTLFNVCVSLILIGLGMGFTMGTPLNYMMLEKTDEAESNSALAMLSLVRSIGTAVAPAIMVGFIAHNAAFVQDDIAEVLPKQVTISALPYEQELSDEIEQMRSDEAMKDMIADMDLPDFAAMRTVDVSMDFSEEAGSTYQVPEYLIDQMKSSDVTTIVGSTKELVSVMFDEISPDLITDAKEGIDAGIEGIKEGRGELEGAIDELSQAINAMNGAMPGGDEMGAGHPGSTGMPSVSLDQMNAQREEASAALEEMQASYDELGTTIEQMTALRDALPGAFEEAKENYLSQIDEESDKIESVFQRDLNKGFEGIFVLVAISSIVGLVLLALYKDDKHESSLLAHKVRKVTK